MFTALGTAEHVYVLLLRPLKEAGNNVAFFRERFAAYRAHALVPAV
jgi:hypothetical protein